MSKPARDDRHDAEVSEQHQQIGVVKDAGMTGFQRNAHPDAQWFPEAGLGLFLHFGISSVLGQGDLSWSMMKDRGPRRLAMERYGLAAVQADITPARYWAQAEGFSADRFDPIKILSAAQQAGMRYAVLTTKHHDGFSLWPSKFGDFNTGRFLKGRDLVGEFVQGCRATGLKVGFYYSPPDWHYHREHMSFRYGGIKPDLDIHHRPTTLPTLSAPEQAARDAGFRAYLKGQVEELLTRYGQIDVLWFDGDGLGAISIERIRELQPGIVINPRAHGVGDFDTAECAFPKTRFPGWWEYCHVFSDGAWGYLDHETYKPLGWLLGEFAKARSWGGNFLPNVGPDAHGELPEAFYKRMAQLASWMAHSAESVLGTTPGPWPERCNVPVTIKGDTWFLHVDWIHEEPAVIKDAATPIAATLLRTGEPVPFTRCGADVSVEIPADSRTTHADVVAVKFTQEA
jgi:alpha-L-fucosidase